MRSSWWCAPFLALCLVLTPAVQAERRAAETDSAQASVPVPAVDVGSGPLRWGTAHAFVEPPAERKSGRYASKAQEWREATQPTRKDSGTLRSSADMSFETGDATALFHHWLQKNGLDPADLQRTAHASKARTLDLLGSNFPIADRADVVSDKERLSKPSIAFNPDRNEYLVVWQAFDRVTSMNIYGQRLSATGTRLGGEFAICQSPGAQAAPDVAYDPGFQQYWVVWTDLSPGDAWDVYAQPVSATGSLLGSAVVVNTGAASAYGARVAAGTYHCAVTWISSPDPSQSHILIRGLNQDGSFYTSVLRLSPADGLASDPDICSGHEDGRFLVVWQEGHSGTGWDVMAFQANWDLTTGGGLTVSSGPNHQLYPRVDYSAGADRYLVVWQDNRSGTSWDVWGQLIARNFSYSGGSLPLYEGPFMDQAPVVAGHDGGSQFFVAFELDLDGAGRYQIYGATVSGNGALAGLYVVRNWYNSRFEPAIAHRSGANEYMVALRDAALGTQDDILTQRMGTDGSPQGGPILVSAGRKGQEEPSLAHNRVRNEYLVVWSDYRSEGDYEIHGRRVSAQGQLLGQELELAVADQLHAGPDVAHNPDDDQYLLVWNAVMSPSSGYDTFARLLGGDGVPLGGPFLLSRDTATINEGLPRVAYNPSAREYLVVWHAFTDGQWRVWAQRVSSTGQHVGRNFQVSASSDMVHVPRLAYSGQYNEYLVEWQDLRTGNWQIYGQRLDGTAAPIGGNFAITSLEGDAGHHDVAYSALHYEYVVVWNHTQDNATDIYAQRVSGLGNMQGGPSIVASSELNEFAPGIAADDVNDGYLVAWHAMHEQTDNDIYGQRLTAVGAPSGSSFAVSAASEAQDTLELAANSLSGEFLIVWQDFRKGSYDIYGQLWRSGPPPTPSPTATSSRTPTRTPTATPTTTATLIATPTRTRTPTATRTVPPVTPTNKVYLPIVRKAYALPSGPTATRTATLPQPSATPSPTVPGEAGISGRVTYNGAPAASIVLTLQRWDGANTSPADATITDSQGHYSFSSAPALGSGELYWVYFGPNSSDDTYLYRWRGPDIETYSPGMAVAGGDFDIANVELLAPAYGAQVSFPVAFAWQRRGIAGDSYQWHLFDPAGEDEWWTDPLEDVGSFTLSGLAEDMAYDHEYGWDVWVYTPEDGFGDSYYLRTVTFLDSDGSGPVSPEGVEVKPRAEGLPWKARGHTRP
jgi:hypothetical protein